MLKKDRKNLKERDLLIDKSLVVIVKNNHLKEPLEVTNIVMGNSYYLHDLTLWNKIDDQELCDKMIELHCNILENKKQRKDLEVQHDKLKLELINIINNVKKEFIDIPNERNKEILEEFNIDKEVISLQELNDREFFISLDTKYKNTIFYLISKVDATTHINDIDVAEYLGNNTVVWLEDYPFTHHSLVKKVYKKENKNEFI